MKKFICIILTIITVFTTVFNFSVSAYDNTLMNDEAWELLIDCIEFFDETGMRFDKNTSAEDILTGFIFGSFQYYYLESSEYYTSYYNGDYYKDPDWVIDPKGLFPREGYRKYFGNNIDKIMQLVFNISDEEINKIHNSGEIYSYSNEYGDLLNQVYYYDGCYYTEDGGTDGIYFIRQKNYAIIEDYGNNTYKLCMLAQWFDLIEESFFGSQFYIYCVIQPSADGSYFTLYGISDKDDIDYTPDNAVSVILNGEKLSFDQPPVIVDGRTLVPIRTVVEAMGGTVAWDDTTKTATLTYGRHIITLTVNSTTAYLDGQANTLDVAPQIIGDRTLMPIRFIAERFGFTADWDNNSRSVIINE